MKNKSLLIMLAIMVTVLSSGCGYSLEREEVAPTSAPEQVEAEAVVTNTPAPTVTPLPTVTSAPRAIGQKTEGAKTVYFANNTNNFIRAMYIKSSYAGEWGESIVPVEYAIKKSEKVQVFYPAITDGATTYDIRIIDANKNTYDIYGVDLTDTEQVAFKIQENAGYLTYMSISENSEKSTQGNSQMYDSGYDQYDSSYDSDYNYNESYYNYDEDYYGNSNDYGYNYNESYYNYDSGYDYNYTENTYYY